MGSGKQYSRAEQKIIIQEIQKSPHNLKHAFEEASKKLRGRAKASISGHYYSTLKPLMNKEGIIVTELTTSQGSIMNTKTVARKESTQFQVVRHLASKLNGEERQKLLDDLFDTL